MVTSDFGDGLKIIIIWMLAKSAKSSDLRLE